MKVALYDERLDSLTTQAIVVPVPQGANRQLPEELQCQIPAAALESFQGKLGDVVVTYPFGGTIQRIALTGLGDGNGDRSRLECFRQAVGSAVQVLKKQQVTECSLYVGQEARTLAGEAVATALLASYQYEKHKSSKSEYPGIEQLTLVVSDKASSASLRPALSRAAALAEAVCDARDLVNAPSNELTPVALARAARTIVKQQSGLKVAILDKAALKREKFGALLAVSQGSHEEPQLITMEWAPAGAKKTVVLVGKGVTFDSGGINIKPSEGMGDMKMDMAGGAVVLATLRAVAALKVPVHVIGIVPATENMPSGTAIKPSDIITTRSGQTVEVANTDAEGRLILADALDYAGTFEPDIILDLATLTGAAVVALGHECGALIGNSPELIEAVRAAGERTGEGVWPLPLTDDYREHVKSEIADVKNLGEGRTAGTIAGAAFLEKFLPGEVEWAHIDIAGPAIKPKAGAYEPKGGTGWGVRLLVSYLESLDRA